MRAQRVATPVPPAAASPSPPEPRPHLSRAAAGVLDQSLHCGSGSLQGQREPVQAMQPAEQEGWQRRDPQAQAGAPGPGRSSLGLFCKAPSDGLLAVVPLSCWVQVAF